MEQTLLKIEDLNIEFHDHEVPERVVNHLTMELRQGEILGIVGESGSGKSMTAMAIAGLLRRHDMKMEGKILFEGKELLHSDREALRQIQGNKIGIVFQEPMTSLNPVKRIGWQVEESLRIHRQELSKEERCQRVLKALEDVELEHPQLIYNKYPHELSGGMRQRVMIASAMICEPKLLIAYEPTTALDVTIQLQIVKLLQRLNQE
ncbi:MAG: ABC transporter ATP-binding protein, partial [Lachnospiraceae bacterium]|nr:ABC transporter ATP-binding protein [Lachnospiraceae bacterium]